MPGIPDHAPSRLREHLVSPTRCSTRGTARRVYPGDASRGEGIRWRRPIPAARKPSHPGGHEVPRRNGVPASGSQLTGRLRSGQRRGGGCWCRSRQSPPVVAIAGALVGVKLTSAPPAGGESVAPAAVVRQITTVRPRCWHGSTAAGRPRCFRRSGHPGGRWPSAENRRSCSSAKSPARSARPSAGRWPSPWPTSARGVTLAPPSPQPPTSTRTPPHSPSAPPATEARN